MFTMQTSSMLHAQEPRMSSSQVKESRSSGVSALVTRLNSSNPEAEDADNEKSRNEPNKTKEQKMQETFPWIPSFSSLCQATVGCRNVKALECLMNKYLEIVTPCVKDCYTKTNRASKLKKNMKNVLIFFHLYYQEVKEALERSSYLDLMMPLVSMFMDMEIKASDRWKESSKKLTSKLTSSLYLFLDNSEEHMLDAIIMTKNVNKKHQDVCSPLLWKVLNNISNPKDAIFYVRCLLTFKLWRNIVPGAEERNRIDKTALQKLHAPPNLLECVKALGNVLPRIPKTKKNITLFLLQSNFNLKGACQEFLKSVKKTRETVYSQSLGNVEIDKPLFFMGGSGSCAYLLSEKDDEVDKSHNAMDLWSSISVDSIASPSDMLKELSSDQATEAEVTLGSKKKRKVGKKVEKGKKKVKESSGMKKKKKKKLRNSESAGLEKGNKKASKLKAKKKKKKKKKLCQRALLKWVKQSMLQGCENVLNKVKQISQVEEATQMAVKSSSPTLIENPDQANVKSPLPPFEQGNQVNPKVILAQSEESILVKLAEAVPQILEESKVEKTVEEAMHCDQEVEIQSSSEMKDDEVVRVVKDAYLLAKDKMKMEEGKVRHPKMEKDQSDASFENSKCDLFGGKPINLFNKEVETLVDHPKTENIETSFSSPKQIFEATIASEVDETLIKKEKADVVSTVCVASQCDLNARMSSKIKEQVTAHQVSSTSIEKIKNKAAECMPNKLTDKSILLNDLVTKTDSEVDQSDDAHEGVMANLFTVDKTKDESSEGKNYLDIPKTEKLSPILVTNTSKKVDELLVKKEKLEVVSNVLVGSVASQFDVKDIMSTEREETDQVAANQIRSITFEKKVNEAFECAKPYMLSGVSVLTSDDLVSKHDNKDKSDIVFDIQRPDLFIVEKSKSELYKEVENLNAPISHMVEEKKDSSYEKTKVEENAVFMYSKNMEKCNSMKGMSDDSVITSVVSNISLINSDSEVENMEKHQETGKCSTSTLEEEIGLNEDLLSGSLSKHNIFRSENATVISNIFDESPNGYAQNGFEQQQECSSELMGTCEYQSESLPCSSSWDYSYDYSCENPFNDYPYENPLKFNFINGDLNQPLEIPLLHQEEKEVDEDSPKSFETSPKKRGLGKRSFSEHKSQSSREGSHDSSGNWNLTNDSGSGASVSGSDSGTESGEADCDTPVGYYTAHTSPDLTSYSKEGFLYQNNYVLKNDNSYLRCASMVMEDVGESAVSKLSSRDSSILEVPSSVPVNFCESDPTSVELSSSRRTKLCHDERIDSQMASSKQVTEDVSVVQAEGQSLNIPIISCPTIPGDSITHETPLKTDKSKDRCSCDECSVGSLKVSASSVDSRTEDPPLKKMKSSSKLSRDDRVGSLIEGKDGAGEISMGQGRPFVRGQRKRGRPPGRGRGVTRTLKISSDIKSACKRRSSQKGKNDPEYQVAQPKISKQYDSPITRMMSKKWGIKDINMFDKGS